MELGEKSVFWCILRCYIMKWCWIEIRNCHLF